MVAAGRLGRWNMDQFRVPQRKIAVELTLAGARKMAGETYAPETGRGGEPGRLIDRLNDGRERFLPVTHSSGGALVSKRSIIAVRLGPGDAEREDCAGEHEREVRVEVLLEEGMTLEGRVAYTLPPDRCRLLDYFNASSRFVALLNPEGATLINTDRVVEIRRPDDPGSRD
jgi:hypothetical protein